MRKVSKEELARHGPGAEQKWTEVNGVVYDVTSFAHPGGQAAIDKIMGVNGSQAYSRTHAKALVTKVLKANVVGVYEGAEAPQPKPKKTSNNNIVTAAAVPQPRKPDLSTVINTFDFEAVAKHTLTKEAWAYYSSGADDEICLRENRLVFSRLRLKPRAMVDVKEIDMSTQILGCVSSLPLYFSATALAGMADEEGEVAITKAAAKARVLYMLPTLSSCSVEDMLQARLPLQQVFSQLYVNADRTRTEEYCRQLVEAGRVEALFVTVDAPQLGRREKDMRMKFGVQANVQRGDSNVPQDEGVTRAISSFIDPSLSWKDVPWLKTLGMPIVLKGVQCVEDALTAFQLGLAGVVLSNHGGRQIDSARSGLEVLAELMPVLRQQPGYDPIKFQVLVDGGIRRGADIFKAVALGATAVGVGRPVLYALASYGQKGVEHAVQVFRNELEMTMRLMGTPSVRDITRRLCLRRAYRCPVARGTFSPSSCMSLWRPRPSERGLL
ncbi:hypothetical protein BASA81_001364 [Batrachochytrium salamandrivorans]|nr:hypothetical protein BASA81_001364 [Batrachochytrium salamandrivorans]